MTNSIARLAQLLPKGATVYTILRHVSQSGMSRDISIIAIKDGEPINLDHFVIDAGIGSRPRRGHGQGVRVSGAGMDMGFHLVYSIARAVHDDGYALQHRWL